MLGVVKRLPGGMIIASGCAMRSASLPLFACGIRSSNRRDGQTFLADMILAGSCVITFVVFSRKSKLRYALDL